MCKRVFVRALDNARENVKFFLSSAIVISGDRTFAFDLRSGNRDN